MKKNYVVYSGIAITLKRNSKVLVCASKQQTERDKVFAQNQEKILTILEDLQERVQRISCKIDMRKKIMIDSYFPVTCLNDLERFLSKCDGLYHLRREEFEDHLYCSVTNTVKLKRPFESTLLSNLFSREFLSSHKWPGPGYIIILKYYLFHLRALKLTSILAVVNIDIWVK